MRNRYNLSFRREQQRRDRTKKAIIVIVALFVFAALGVLIYFAWNNINWNSIGTGSKNTATDGSAKSGETVDLTINCVGDIMISNSQIEAAGKDGDYDFDESFEYIKDDIKKANLSLFNLETTFGGSPYSGSNKYSAPDELADSLKDAGFDVALTSNEHVLDMDKDGVERTIETLEDAGLKQTGSVKDADDKDYLIKKVKGVKVGIISYTQETSDSEGTRSLNDSDMDDDERDMINSFSNSRMKEDKEDIKDSIKNAKEDGAKIIVCYFHWGDDKASEPDEDQKQLARIAARNGADVIFGSHPQVIQKQGTVKGKNGKKVPVFYSMGNFLSNQRESDTGTAKTEQGMIAEVKITYDKDNKSVKAVKTGYVPTWVNKFWDDENSKNVFTVIPLSGDFRDYPTLEQSDETEAAEDALKDIEDVLGEPKSVIKSKKSKD